MKSLGVWKVLGQGVCTMLREMQKFYMKDVMGHRATEPGNQLCDKKEDTGGEVQREAGQVYGDLGNKSHFDFLPSFRQSR